MKKLSRTLALTLAVLLSLSNISNATVVSTAAKDLAKKVDIEDVKAVTGETVKAIADTGVEKGKELIDTLDSEYSDDIAETGAKTKSLWDRFVEWIKEAFNYLMHLFLFDSKDNLLGTLNEGIEKQNKEATSSVLDDITNIANNRVANADLDNLNISSIDRVTTKLPKVEKKKKEVSKQTEEKEEEPVGVKKSTEDILKEAAERTKAASKEDIKEGAKEITDTISNIGDNIEKVGDTLDNLGTNLGDLIN